MAIIEPSRCLFRQFSWLNIVPCHLTPRPRLSDDLALSYLSTQHPISFYVHCFVRIVILRVKLGNQFSGVRAGATIFANY